MSTEPAELKLHPLLKLIDPNFYSKERIEELWKKLQQEEYAFDDTSRGDAELFLGAFLLPNNLFFEIGDLEGIVMVQNILPRVSAILHFSVWGDVSVTSLNRAANSLCGYLFDRYQLHRLTAFIPQANNKAKRMAVLLLMKYEGTIREAFFYHGEFEDITIYGLLRTEFDTIRRF